MADLIPVLTIDGPSGVGKGTVSRIVADRMGWHYLDSGALYRAVAVVAQQRRLDCLNENVLADCARDLQIQFVSLQNGDEPRVIAADRDITDVLRLETTGTLASSIAAFPAVREALKVRQRAFRQLPGLVADGRDMGTVIFPDASCKVFLVASAEERAQRRYNQLKGKGVSVTFMGLLQEISARDAQDARRAVAPLQPAADAVVIDTTSLDIEAVVMQVSTLVMTSADRS